MSEGLGFLSETISKVTAKRWGVKVGAGEASRTGPKEQKRDCARHSEEALQRMETAGVGGASWPGDRWVARSSLGHLACIFLLPVITFWVISPRLVLKPQRC